MVGEITQELAQGLAAMQDMTPGKLFDLPKILLPVGHVTPQAETTRCNNVTKGGTYCKRRVFECNGIKPAETSIREQDLKYSCKIRARLLIG